MKVNSINHWKKNPAAGKVYYGSRSKPNTTHSVQQLAPTLSPGVRCTHPDGTITQLRSEESREHTPVSPWYGVRLPLLLSIGSTMQVHGSIYLLRWTENVINFNNLGLCALHTGQVHPEQVSLTSSHVHKTSSDSTMAAKTVCVSFP